MYEASWLKINIRLIGKADFKYAKKNVSILILVDLFTS